MKQKRGRKFKTNSTPVPRIVEDGKIFRLRSWHKKVVGVFSLVRRTNKSEILNSKSETNSNVQN
jgi:hypothetical protein